MVEYYVLHWLQKVLFVRGVHTTGLLDGNDFYCTVVVTTLLALEYSQTAPKACII